MCIEKRIVLPDTFDNASVGKGIDALPVLFAILPFTDRFIPAGKGIGALPVPFTSLVFTDVFILCPFTLMWSGTTTR